MMPPQIVTDPEVREPWSSWAKVADLPSPDEVVHVDEVVDTQPERTAPTAPAGDPDLTAAVAQLAAELADERRQRTAAEDGRREAESRLHDAELAAAHISAEVTAARARIAELERDRDEVIRRAEELLTALRERADQRLASELEGANRHWTEVLAAERQRVEALECERAVLMTRMEDAWLAVAVLRRSRPLRPRTSSAADPATIEEAEAEVLEVLEEHETDPVFAAESPEVAEEIALLRQRLRARVHKPAEIDEVEDGVDQLREARLAREAAPKGRRRK
jgi:hypothetical protein